MEVEQQARCKQEQFPSSGLLRGRAAGVCFGPGRSRLRRDQASCMEQHTLDDVAIPDSHFRVLLLRRLRMPLPLRRCSYSCRGALDAYGDHRAACSTSGVLASRAVPPERAIARVCQAGARVGRNVAIAAMNSDVPVHDARRIEVV